MPHSTPPLFEEDHDFFIEASSTSTVGNKKFPTALSSIQHQSTSKILAEQEKHIEQLQNQLQAIEKDHEDTVFSLHAHIKDLTTQNRTLHTSLQEEKCHALELEGQTEHTGHLRDAMRELTRQIKFLETRNTALRNELTESHNVLKETEKERSDAHARLQNALKHLQIKEELEDDVHALVLTCRDHDVFSTCNNNTLVAESESKNRQIAYLQQCIHAAIEHQISWDATEKRSKERISSLESELEKERQNSKELQTSLDTMTHEIQSLQRTHEDLVEAQDQLTQCKEELTAAAARAAAAVVDSQRWQEESVRSHALAKEAEAAAHVAIEEAQSLKSSADARDERVSTMRDVASTALERCDALICGLDAACGVAMQLLQDVIDGTMSRDSNPATRQCSIRGDDELGDVLRATLIKNLRQSIESFRDAHAALHSNDDSGIDLDNNNNMTTSIDYCIESIHTAFAELIRGYSCVTEALDERKRLHAALTGALTETIALRGDDDGQRMGGGDEPAQSTDVPLQEHGALIAAADATTPSKSLEYMVQRLLDAVMDTALTLKREKDQMGHAKEAMQQELTDLHLQVSSLQSVLMAMPDGDSLIKLAMKKERVEELESTCKELKDKLKHAEAAAADAKAAASRDWAGVKTDIAHLVRTAELAQTEAEVALQRQRAESAKQVNAARAKFHEAEAARCAAEAHCAALREENAMLGTRLHGLKASVTAAERRACIAEETVKSMNDSVPGANQQGGSLDRTAGEGSGEENQQSTSQGASETPALMLEIARLEDMVATLQEESVIATAEMHNTRVQLENAHALAAVRDSLLADAERRAEEAASRVDQLQKETTARELRVLDLETQLQSAVLEHAEEREAANCKVKASMVTATPINDAATLQSLLGSARALQTSDVSVLQKRLKTALHQLESMSALNRNLEQQLAAATASRRRSHKIGAGGCVTHAMLDALALHGSSVSSSLQPPSNDRHDDPCIERVINLWKEACARREERVHSIENEVRTMQSERAHLDAELAGMNTALQSAKKAKDAAFAAVEELKSQLTELELSHKAATRELLLAQDASKDVALLRHRVDAAEGLSKELQGRLSSAETIIDGLRASLEKERMAASDLAETLRRCGDFERRAFDAEQRAQKAEEALAKQLASVADINGVNGSIGQQLETAWKREQALAQKMHAVREELAEAHGKLNAYERDAETKDSRIEALQSQLAETVEALVMQGNALEGLLKHRCQ